MLYLAGNLRTTAVAVGTYPCCFPFDTHKGCATLGAVADELDRLRVRLTLGFLDACDFGYDFTTFFDVYPVAMVDVELTDDVVIVERSTLDDSARQLHRLKVGYRGDDTHATCLKRYESKLSTSVLRIELVGNGPTRRFSSIAEVELLS